MKGNKKERKEMSLKDCMFPLIYLYVYQQMRIENRG
jgi:hypothetical protein